MTRDQLIAEINQIPENRLEEVYQLLHRYRANRPKSAPVVKESILDFAGSWSDLDDQVFYELLDDITNRRKTAFKSRRAYEANLN